MFVNKRLSKESRGFTLAELIVSVSIIVTFSLIFLVKYRTFTSSISLNNLAYEVGLAIRQAQVYGISVREQGEVGIGEFQYAYGVFMRTSQPKTIIFFSDNVNTGSSEGVYNEGAGTELLEIFTINGKSQIDSFCAYVGGGTTCTPFTGGLNITFERPDPNALIKQSDGTQLSSVDIILESIAGDQKTVTVTNTGQISIE